MGSDWKYLDELTSAAEAMVTPGKGILAADESTGTITKRFAAVGVESTEENRRDYREFLFRSEGFERYISGVILFDETIREKAADGTPLVEILKDRGVIPGIKVDKGAKPLAGSPDETVPKGWTVSGSGWTSIGRWVPGSPSGGPSSISERGLPRRMEST